MLRNDAGMLLEVPVFSKFLHATALLYPSQVSPRTCGSPHIHLRDARNLCKRPKSTAAARPTQPLRATFRLKIFQSKALPSHAAWTQRARPGVRGAAASGKTYILRRRVPRIRSASQPAYFSAEAAPRAVQVARTGVPYWFLPDEGGAVSPATYEEMADTTDIYDKVRTPLPHGLPPVGLACYDPKLPCETACVLNSC